MPVARMPSPDRDAIEAAILGVLGKRDPGKTICPSEAARQLSPEHWRTLLSRVRSVAARMAEEDRLVILRKGRQIPPAEMRGVIRLALPSDPSQPG